MANRNRGRKARGLAHAAAEADPAGREQYLRDNAAAEVAARDRLIGRLRRRVAELEQAKRALRAEVARLKGGAG